MKLQHRKISRPFALFLCVWITLTFQGPRFSYAQQAPVTEITMDQAVNLALTNNPTGKIAVFEFEAAKGALTAARSYRWPTLSYNHKDAWTWHGEKYNDRYYSGDRNFIDDQFTNALTLNWTVWAEIGRAHV